MLNDYVTKSHFDETIETINKKLDKLEKIEGQLDWLVGKYNAHDEEHTLLNNKASEHSDQIEVINTKLGIQI